VNGIGRMTGFGGRKRRELLIDRGAAMAKGTANRGEKALDRSDQVDQPRPGSGLSFSP
jgi:hypothetical protein